MPARLPTPPGSPPPLVLCADGGGSKVCVVIRSADGLEVRGTAGPCNVYVLLHLITLEEYSDPKQSKCRTPQCHQTDPFSDISSPTATPRISPTSRTHHPPTLRPHFDQWAFDPLSLPFFSSSQTPGSQTSSPAPIGVGFALRL